MRQCLFLLSIGVRLTDVLHCTENIKFCFLVDFLYNIFSSHFFLVSMVDLQAFGVDQNMIYFESSDIICFLGKLKLFGNNTIPDTFF